MSTSKNNPLVTIGVPVFNEGKYLDNSLDALATQDYDNLEILLSDNGSDDNTETICNKYSSKYDFIKYHRFKENMGIAVNSSYVLKQASGKYFMWASGHDLWASNYISECVKLLEKSPNTLIAFGSSKWISAKGSPLQRQFGWLDTRGLDVLSRYVMTFWGNMHPILGVINREVLISDEIINTPGADMIILCRLSLQGAFAHAANTAWSRREVRNESTYKDKLTRYKSNNFGMGKSFIDKLLPLARLPIELIKNVLTCNQPTWIKIVLILLLFMMFPAKYLAGKFLASDH